jgi:hypothetical protein
MPEYKVIYRTKAELSSVTQQVIDLPNVKSLARYLNSLIRRHPDKEVLAVYIVDKNGRFIRSTKFLTDEFKHQYWFTGYKERLLANALEKGYEINWKPCYMPPQGRS